MKIKALTFDVFGTVADWRTTLIREAAALGKKRSIEANWVSFADTWRAQYEPSMHRVRTGELPWTNLDGLHHMIMEDLLEKFQISGLQEADKTYLTQVWHRLDLWPDVLAGMDALRRQFTVAALSNGNVAILTNIAKNADLRWDCILSAELARHYKPDPEVYLTAATHLGLPPEEIMMVAAHNNDLQAARAVGFKTAFVYRTTEYGPNQQQDLEPDPYCDFVAIDFIDLASQLFRQG
ncbi:MAG: haloacid dehalogenase type II [Bacteroidota bacterium]